MSVLIFIDGQEMAQKHFERKLPLEDLIQIECCHCHQPLLLARDAHEVFQAHNPGEEIRYSCERCLEKYLRQKAAQASGGPA